MVGPPTDDEIRRIVAEPARRTGTTVEPALVDLVAAMSGIRSRAPAGVGGDGRGVGDAATRRVMRCERYLELGGLATVVERLGEQSARRSPATNTSTPYDGSCSCSPTSPTTACGRDAVSRRDFPRRRALESLVSSRLVVRTDETVEIIHEVVFRAWPQLAAWLDEARSRPDPRTRAARRRHGSWDSDGRPEDHLYRGTRSQAALEWAERSTGPIAAVLTEFLAAGRQLSGTHDHEIREQLQRERRARRRISWALVAAGVLLVSAVVAGATAINSRNDANDAAALAEARRVSTQALASEDYDQALLLAVEGRHLDDSTETRSNLLETIQRSPDAIAVIRSDTRSVPRPRPHTGRHDAAGERSRGPSTLSTYDVATREPESVRPRRQSQVSSAVSPDGRLAVMSSTDGAERNSRAHTRRHGDVGRRRCSVADGGRRWPSRLVVQP